MAHPYAGHKQTSVEHRRVGHITKGYASGGAVRGYSDDDSKVRKMSPSLEKEVNPEGGVAKHRMDRPGRAKGGKVKGKHNAKTIVNVITGGHPAGGAVPPMPMAPPPAGLAGAVLPPPPMAAKPPMMPPPGPPMGGPPPMPMRAKGGRVNEGTKVYEQSKRSGTQVTHDTGKSDLPDMNRKRVVTFKAGGVVKSFMAGGRVEASDKIAPATELPGGSGGGKARLVKAHRAARK